MIRVVLTYPNGQQTEVLLAGVPRVGESIRLRNGRTSTPPLVVEHVLWMEGEDSPPEPSVIVSVRPHTEGPPR